MTDRETMVPRWRLGGNLYTTNPRRYDDGAIEVYPVDLNGHSVQVTYTFDTEQGRTVLVGITYECEQCDAEVDVKSGHLPAEDDQTIAQLKGWCHGFFLETDACV